MKKYFGALFLTAGLLCATADLQAAGAPAYTAQSIVNLASLQAGLTPNTVAALFGENLALVTRSRTDEDTGSGTLPIQLPGTGVTVLVNRVAASLEMVSPKQVNFIVPPYLKPGMAEIILVLNGRAGPPVKVPIVAVAPEFFRLDENVALARHLDEKWNWVTADYPVQPNEHIIVYAASLGATAPEQVYRKICKDPARLADVPGFHLYLGQDEISPERIEYVGAMVGFPGLYEIRVQLPETLTHHPELHIRIGDVESQRKVILPTNVPAPAPDPVEPETPNSRSN